MREGKAATLWPACILYLWPLQWDSAVTDQGLFSSGGFVLVYFGNIELATLVTDLMSKQLIDLKM